ncbi:MAG TPA: chromate efflux transporter [Polyangiaceae bacterium]|nr:chromate efflux transporter [Polyangiaceae bacterium]
MGSGEGGEGGEGGGRRARLWELARLFLRLGATAFGGPAVHIALMEEEVVRRRKWLTDEELLDLIGATNLIPGPNSTELAIHIGYRRAGSAGLVVAGACFIVPAALITVAFAVLYERYRFIPAAAAVLYGLKPAILGVIAAAVVRLGRTSLKSAAKRWISILAFLAALGASLAGGDELLVLFGAGGLGMIHSMARSRRGPPAPAEKPAPSPKSNGLIAALPVLSGTAAAASKSTLLALTVYFLKIGSLLYGSGYVLVSFLRGDLVLDRGWITEQQLIDAVAVGQATPGPVFTTATFIGYLLHGPAGAALATTAIFVPSFALVRLTSPFVARLRASAVLGGFLDGVNAGSLGLLAAVLGKLAAIALVGWPAYVLAALGVAAALVPKLNPTWVLLGGAAAGLLLSFAGLATLPAP